MPPSLTVALITLGDPDTLTGGYLFHRRLAELAPRHDARVTFVSLPLRPFPLATFDAPQVMRAVGHAKADVIVVDSIAAAFLGPWLTLQPPPVPTLAMLHQPPGGIDFPPPRRTIQAWLDRRTYRHARLLLAASDALASDLVAGGLPRRRVRVVPPGRDVSEEIAPPPADPRRGRKLAALCVGNWMERKGIRSLLDALALLPDGDVTLHLIGRTDVEPQYTAQLRARLAERDLAERVVVHGPLSRAQVAAWYAATDVFALPSLVEPFGTVYGEAMAFGLPVVGWRAGNLPFLADDGVEGVILAPGDVAGLAAALARLAHDSVLRRRMGDAARQRALSRPTWDDTAARFFEFARAVAHRHRTVCEARRCP